jgi:membrane protein required for colicin V production
MALQWPDFVVAGIMLLSGLLALMRGFVREVLSLIAWGGAALAGLGAVLSPDIVGMAKQYLQPDIVAQIAVGAG